MLASLLLAVVISQSVTPGVLPGRPGAPAPGAATEKGTASIKGRITAADTGRPLRRARVSVSAPGSESKATSTNVRGEFELRDLPGGRYQLSVQRSGYLPMTYGQRVSGEPARPLQLADGEKLERVEIAMPRASTITGKLVDEFGEPIAGVRVWPMRLEYFRGRRRLVPAGGNGESDDAGNYRIVNVPPGEYLVMAMSRETWVARDKHRYAYARTFFPGAAQPASATPVKVAAGRESANVDFSLVPVRTATISGTAVGADGAPLAGGRVSLAIEIMGNSGGGMVMSSASASIGADGSWTLRDVPPGEYALEVSRQERDREPERGAMALSVQGTEVSGLHLVADAGGTITGQVVTEDGQPLPAAATRLRVSPEPVGPDAQPFAVLATDDNGVVGTDGRFRLKGVSGPSMLRVWTLPSGWVVKGVEGGERAQLDSPVEVKAGATLDVRILLTNRFPTISGRITDDKGAATDGVVLLVPADDEKWKDVSLLRSARPDQSGTYRFPNVHPGDYLAIALDTIQSWQAADPEFISGLKNRATSLSVREGQPETANLRVVR